MNYSANTYRRIFNLAIACPLAADLWLRSFRDNPDELKSQLPERSAKSCLKLQSDQELR